MSFEKLGLDPTLLRAVASQGYEQPTPIQAEAIPAILAGQDLLAAAQTGTGKTAAFTLPLLQQLLTDPQPPANRHGRRIPRVLVLVPTRELAAQVADSIRDYGRNVPIRTTTIFGGAGMQPQINALRRGVDVVVATPGRLMDHIERRNIDLSAINRLVLDEADRMLDMGFINDIRKIIGLLPERRRQNLLFSATFSAGIRTLANSLLQSPQTIDIAPRNSAAEQVTQNVYSVDKNSKRALLEHLLRSQSWGQTLVFTRTKHGADRLTEQLLRSGLRAAAIHGNKSQGARTRALTDFRNNRVQLLIATDIAARGLDIDALPHVVNYELPQVAEDYVHRIGRTGRAQYSGAAVSLVSADENTQLKAIEKVIGRKLERQVEAGFEPSARPPADKPAGKKPGKPRQQRQRQDKAHAGNAKPRSNNSRRGQRQQRA
ncbi:ATP-dependent RNA helicase RhlE [Methylohalomonas lacus]|uniref:DEAD-box ATP-dependent RNA helicase RhpA n=1 Tax=Methylohalomonas lacus TaxID=398773 RepID=A0AAE3HNS8_9GAMM|nr:DEAD/DEAH box helicase [Methylohalomonas lacus]MCS3904127.1 ATP-dependent RNA helicase RhlE [Methylohalomonas lacus]